MSDAVDIILYIVVAGGIFLAVLVLRKPRAKHMWFEVGSSDIANAERKKKKGK